MGKSSFRLLILSSAVTLLLSACGGGSSDLVADISTAALVASEDVINDEIASIIVNPNAVAVEPSGFSSSSSVRLNDRSGTSAVPATESASTWASLGTVNTNSFVDELTALDSTRWWASNWNNGSVFLNGWHPNQITFPSGHMEIALKADAMKLTGTPAISGEYRSSNFYSYGTYKATMMPVAKKGTISSIFTYVGADTGKPHDEIDIEFKGDDLTKIQVNYWTNGVEHPTMITLGFDASLAYHDYAFHWSATGIEWYVDNKLVHSETGSRGALPTGPGQIMLNHWGTVNAMPWSTDYVVSTTPSVLKVERVSYTSDTATATVVPTIAVGGLTSKSYKDTTGWRAATTVTVRDSSGSLVSGAVVTAGMTAGGSPLACTTTTTGMCTITSGKISSSTIKTVFTIKNIAKLNMKYDATKNSGSTATILKP